VYRSSADSKELAVGQLWEACATHRTFQADLSLERSAGAKLYVLASHISVTDGQQAPGGSSTGSAMGVVAGFSPLSLGTEISGSLTSRASRAVLYALKLTPGAVNMKRVWQVAASFDTAGGMAKSARDLAMLSDILLQQANPARAWLVDAMQDDWEGLSVGFVDIELWRLPPEARGDVPGYNEQSVSVSSNYSILILTLERSSCGRLSTG
jgi:hypothetical protein